MMPQKRHHLYMSTLKLTAQIPSSLSWRRPWLYASILGMVGLLSLANFTVLPLVAQSYTIPISPVGPQAEPALGTLHLLADLNTQNLGAKALGYVTHPYLAGRGRLVSFVGDNIQIFEYPTNEIANKEAWAIFDRTPRLATKDYFHVFLKNNLIGLYFGYNSKVLTVTEGEMGYPLAK